MSDFDLGARIRQAIAAKQRRDLTALQPDAAEPADDNESTNRPTFNENLRRRVNPNEGDKP